MQAALRLIRQGTLGTITGFHAHVDRQMEYYYQFLDYTREPGGGIGYDLGIYYLTVLLSILGPVASVTGMIKTSRPVRAYTKEDSDRFGQNYEIQNENLMVATVQMQSGVLGTLHFNGDAVMPESSTLLLEGTRGILYLGNPDRFGDNLRIFEAGENDQEPAELTREIPVSGAYACNSRGLGVSEMADAIEKGRRPRTDCAMSVHALEVFDGITQSSQTGKSVQMRTSFEVPEPFEAE